MVKFFVFTRGRTGSTAIVDELNNSEGVLALQELFIRGDFSGDENDALEEKNAILRFDLWKKRDPWFLRIIPFSLGDKYRARRYFCVIEERAHGNGASAFGLKVLTHHFTQRPYLADILRARGYKAIYLRRNVARQVLSGMLAQQTGVYNLKGDFNNEKEYEIDLREYEAALLRGKQELEMDVVMLRESGFPVIVVDYEDWLSDREGFFGTVLEYLEVPYRLPSKTDYAVMIKDMAKTIKNIDEVESCARSLGVPLV